MSCSLATAIARYNGSSCLEKDDDDFKNLSASLYLCAAEFVQRQSTHTCTEPASK